MFLDALKIPAKNTSFESFIERLVVENRELRSKLMNQQMIIDYLIKNAGEGAIKACTINDEDEDEFIIEYEPPWFVQVGQALSHLKEALLTEFPCAEQGPLPRWGETCKELSISQSYANRLIAAAEVYVALRSAGIDEDDLPIYERQVRPLVRFKQDPSILKYLWEEALVIAEDIEFNSLPRAGVVEYVVGNFERNGRK
ncbi:hypothetical protein B2D07_18965 [Desulfococcus multivorans]|nr:hypothetical protein B2D07_18965 [Desulfococcus multivorans]